MTRPTVVVLCVHGEANEHWPRRPHAYWLIPCPGGRVLEQAVIIERDTDGRWPKWAFDAMGQAILLGSDMFDALASAQENQP